MYLNLLPVEATASCSCCHGTCDVVLRTTMSDDCHLEDVLKHRTMYAALLHQILFTDIFHHTLWVLSRHWPLECLHTISELLPDFCCLPFSSYILLLIFNYVWMVYLPSVHWQQARHPVTCKNLRGLIFLCLTLLVR